MTYFTILLLQLISAGMMTSLIWMIQILHYPSFHYIANLSSMQSSSFHQFHSTRISFIVIPLMLIELVTAFYLAMKVSFAPLSWQTINFGLVLALWAVTFLVQIPHHTELTKSFTSKEVQDLVAFNWIRTAIWTVHFLIAFYAVLKTISPHVYALDML